MTEPSWLRKSTIFLSSFLETTFGLSQSFFHFSILLKKFLIDRTIFSVLLFRSIFSFGISTHSLSLSKFHKSTMKFSILGFNLIDFLFFHKKTHWSCKLKPCFCIDGIFQLSSKHIFVGILWYSYYIHTGIGRG